MSANSSNRKLQRKQNIRKARRGNTLQSVALAPLPIRNPDQEFVFQRRLGDLSIFVDNTGTAQVLTPPGFTVTPFLQVGSGIADLTGLGLSPSWAIPFYWEMEFSELPNAAALTGFFLEYQLRQVELEFQSLQGDSYNLPSGYGFGGGLPEILTCVKPDANTLPGSIQSVLAFPMTQRSTLTLEKPHKTRFRPRIPMVDNGGNLLFLDNQKEAWQTSPNGAWNGLVGWLRNYPAATTAAGPFFPIRASCIVTIAARRPR